MFGLMKHFLKEKMTPPNAVKLADIHVGCAVGFGFMPQKNISGRRMPVTEINSYLFEDDSFVSFRLEHGNADISIIVADEDESGTYLALSQRIEERLVSPLFSSRHPRGWFALGEGDKIVVNRDILGVPAGWLVSRYKVVMSTKGRLLEGDFRLRKPSSYASLAKPFDYVLLVDEANEYALEAEQYEDGTCHVYSTVYRPATDIGEISRPHLRSVIPGADRAMLLEEKIEHVPPSLPVAAKAEAPVKHVPREIALKDHAREREQEELVKGPVKDTVKKVARATPENKEGSIATAAKENVPVKPEAQPSTRIVPQQEKLRNGGTVDKPVAPAQIQADALPPAKETAQHAIAAVAGLAEVTPVHGKFGRIQPTSSHPAQQQPAEMLACDIALAGRIIDEAQRNHLLISELIRKVIDLPVRVQDHILIPFALSDGEYAELARRYGLQASDRAGVMNRVLEELRRFAGAKI